MDKKQRPNPLIEYRRKKAERARRLAEAMAKVRLARQKKTMFAMASGDQGPPHLAKRHRSDTGLEEDEQEPIDHVLCKVDDIPDNDKKEFEVNGKKVVVVRQGGNFYALGAICTHHGAPLAKGILCGGKLRCPRHGACFDVKTGDIEDCPGIDSLPRYKTRVDNGTVYINGGSISKDSPDTRQRLFAKFENMNKMDPIVVIGSGAAGFTFVETLRIHGWSGIIAMISDDINYPYDRIQLSKKPDVKLDDVKIRTADFYQKNNIDVFLDSEVILVNTQDKCVEMRTNEGMKTLTYWKLMLATGGIPKKLPVPGANLNHVHYLRNVEHAEAINADVKGKEVVVIGSSFIGMEIAGTISQSGAKQVTVISQTPEVMQSFGPEIGKAIQLFFESKGVRFVLGAEVEALEADVRGNVQSVRIKNKDPVKAERVIVGIGVAPATEFLRGSGIAVEKDGFVKVDRQFRTNIPDVVAAGDITKFSLELFGEDAAHIEHWQTGQKQGENAAIWMCGGEPKPIVPFFWTRLFGEKMIRLSGYPFDSDDELIKGDPKNFDFLKYYFKKDNVVAVAGSGSKELVVLKFKFIFGKNLSSCCVTREDVEKNKDDNWDHLL